MLCSICAAPAEIQKAVNDSLKNRERLRDLSKRSGFSRSALSRHSRKCIRREVLAQHRSDYFQPGDQIAVVYPSGTSHEWSSGKPFNADEVAKQIFFVLEVVYEKPPAPREAVPSRPPEGSAEGPQATEPDPSRPGHRPGNNRPGVACI